MEDFKLIITQVGEEITTEMFTRKNEDDEWTPYEMTDKRDLMLLRRISMQSANTEMRKQRVQRLAAMGAADNNIKMEGKLK